MWLEKSQGIWLILMRAAESLKTCTLIGSFCRKHVKIQMKKYRRVMFHDTEEWCKVWRKTDLWFQKRHEEFGEFSPKHSKAQKFQFDGLFLSNVYVVWAKEIQRSYLSWHRTVMQNLYTPRTCGLKNGMIWQYTFFFINNPFLTLALKIV